jgi:hypothetical protein
MRRIQFLHCFWFGYLKLHCRDIGTKTLYNLIKFERKDGRVASDSPDSRKKSRFSLSSKMSNLDSRNFCNFSLQYLSKRKNASESGKRFFTSKMSNLDSTCFYP